MRRFSRSSSLLIRSSTSWNSGVLISSSNKYYSSSSSKKELDEQYAKVAAEVAAKVHSRFGTKNPSFSDLISVISSDPETLNKITRLSTPNIFPNTTPSSPTGRPVKVAVTGAAGAIGYALLFRIASGQLLGLDTPIHLQCLEIPQGIKPMEGVKMELNDCAFPLLRGVDVTDNAEKAFDGAEYVFFVGAQPRTKGMDRAELLKKNAGIFSAQGKALNKTADRSKVKILVVGNPANTNCLIAANNAPNIDPRQFSAMTRLDHNRGLAQLAEKLRVNIPDLKKFAIWGNHSDTQYPDITSATARGEAVRKQVDATWNADTFIPTVAKRGAAIIAARGSSSAASAANAAIDQMRDWALGSNGEWVSMAVWTGEKGSKIPYGVSEEIYYSYPVICEGGSYKIVEGLPIDADSARRMQLSNDELVKERSDAGELAVRQK